MISQVLKSREIFITLRTYKMFVGLSVLFKGDIVSEFLFTVRTVEHFISSVHAIMYFQVII